MLTLKEGTRPPWVGLAAAVWAQIAAGNGYTFPLYSHSLKSVLRYNQHQLTMLGVANDIGENLGILPGIACNKFPPSVILLVGALASFCGFGILWLSLSQTILHMPYWLLWLALCLATNSSAWLSTAVLVTNMRNFPVSRGTVAGILKGYGGISACVFTVIYSILLDRSSSKLLLFLALGIPALCFPIMYFVRACNPASNDESSDHRRFLFIQIVLIVLGLYILSISLLDHILNLSSRTSFLLLIVMILLLMAPLGIPVKMTFHRTNPQEGTCDPLLKEAAVGEADEASEIAMLLAEGEGAVKKKRRPKRGEDFKFAEALVKADFWLLFFVYFAGVGTGVTVLNNLAQIGIALGLQDTTILLSLFSFCNFAGRLGGGVVSEHFVRSKRLPRTVWMTFTQVLMAGTYLLFASALRGTLYVATASLGICYGVQFSIMIPTVSELFGLKHFGVFFNFMLLGNPLGAYLFSGILAGYVYDTEAGKQEGSNVCVGPNCFGLTFVVLACVCGVASMLSVVLTVRIRPVYEMLYASGSFRLPQPSCH